MAAAFEKYKRGADSENAQKKKKILVKIKVYQILLTL